MLYFDKIMLYNVAVCVKIVKFIERERFKAYDFFKKSKRPGFFIIY